MSMKEIRADFNKDKFILDYFEKDWDLILNVEKNYVSHYFDNFLLNMNGLLDKHAPFEKVSKYQLKLKTKPCHELQWLFINQF